MQPGNNQHNPYNDLARTSGGEDSASAQSTHSYQQQPHQSSPAHQSHQARPTQQHPQAHSTHSGQHTQPQPRQTQQSHHSQPSHPHHPTQSHQQPQQHPQAQQYQQSSPQHHQYQQQQSGSQHQPSYQHAQAAPSNVHGSPQAPQRHYQQQNAHGQNAHNPHQNGAQQNHATPSNQGYSNAPSHATPHITGPRIQQQQDIHGAPLQHARQAPVFSEEALRLHDESVELFPEINLSKGEFVIKIIRRHPIGLLGIWSGVGAVVLASLAVIVFIFVSQGLAGLQVLLAASVIALFVCGITAGGAMIATYVYRRNLFIITNESVINQIQKGIFTKREQTISLRKVEDVSYRQAGIIEHIFGFGTIRLSTIGEEHSYNLIYIKNPKPIVDFLNNAVEAFTRSWPMIEMVDRASIDKELASRSKKHKTSKK